MFQLRHLLAGGLLSVDAMLATAAPSKGRLDALEMRTSMEGRAQTTERDVSTATPEINMDFPDPALIQVGSTWYSFATNSNGKHVQAASAPAVDGPWTWINTDVLPVGGWTTGNNTWAPDVRQVADGTFVMYFTGEYPGAGGRHCVGVATSKTILGPYTPQNQPFACPLDQGGAIDASGFVDPATGTRYVVYKVDGNNLGHGGDCNNGVAPIVSTPILLQEVKADGIPPVGNPVQILDRSDVDGPLVEAPNLIRLANGTYVLFYSSDCFTSPNYSVRYATGPAVTGPFTKAATALLATGDYGLVSPGGATNVEGGGKMLYHANCAVGRCLYAADYTLGQSVVVH